MLRVNWREIDPAQKSFAAATVLGGKQPDVTGSPAQIKLQEICLRPYVA
jgi:hypothetical protein